MFGKHFFEGKSQKLKGKSVESRLRRDGIFLVVEWAGVFLLVVLLFELPILTCCQTTSVFYQKLTGCKGKSAVFGEKKHIQPQMYTDFPDTKLISHHYC
jgi:hypothetical protein